MTAEKVFKREIELIEREAPGTEFTLYDFGRSVDAKCGERSVRVAYWNRAVEPPEPRGLWAVVDSGQTMGLAREIGSYLRGS